MEKFFSSILDNYSKLSLFILLAIAFFFLFNSDNFQLDASSDTLILEQDDDLKRYQELIKDYNSSDFLIEYLTKHQILRQLYMWKTGLKFVVYENESMH